MFLYLVADFYVGKTSVFELNLADLRGHQIVGKSVIKDASLASRNSWLRSQTWSRASLLMLMLSTFILLVASVKRVSCSCRACLLYHKCRKSSWRGAALLIYLFFFALNSCPKSKNCHLFCLSEYIWGQVMPCIISYIISYIVKLFASCSLYPCFSACSVKGSRDVLVLFWRVIKQNELCHVRITAWMLEKQV